MGPMSKIVDFHSHILPGIDDGSDCTATSIAMLRMEVAQGISHVVATPHFYARHDTPKQFLARRNEAEARLREAMAGYEGMPRMEVGAEVYFFSGISDSDALFELTIADKKFILIEMPYAQWTQSMYRELEQIQLRHGITPIIAHVDRYIGPFKTHGIPEQLEQLPVLVQANASFFLNRGTRAMALRMLRKDQIQLLGSDCHNLHSRAPNLGEAVQTISQRLGQAALDRIESYQGEVLVSRNNP